MFREDKTTQMAAQFLKLSGGKLEYIHLLKLMYIADKEMVIRWGMPITYDTWAALPFGPILSETYNLTKKQPREKNGYWAQHISTQGNFVKMTQDPGDDELSRAEDKIIAETFSKWGKMNRWDVVEATHQFPEWSDPNGSSYPISYAEMLKANDCPQEIKSLVAAHIESQQVLSELSKGA